MYSNYLKSIFIFQYNRGSTLPRWSLNFFVFQYFFLFCLFECILKIFQSFKILVLFNLRISIYEPFFYRITTDTKFYCKFWVLVNLIVLITVHGVCIVILRQNSIKNCLMFIMVLKQILFKDVVFHILAFEIAKDFIILKAKRIFICSKYFWVIIFLCFKKFNYRISIFFWNPNQSNIIAIILFTFITCRN